MIIWHWRPLCCTYPRFGPFGAKIGNAIPTKPHKQVIKRTGTIPILYECLAKVENSREQYVKSSVRCSYSDDFGAILINHWQQKNISRKRCDNHMIWQSARESEISTISLANDVNGTKWKTAPVVWSFAISSRALHSMPRESPKKMKRNNSIVDQY